VIIMGEVVLSYGDTLIREAEIKLLKGSGWLNDQIIGFAFEYIQTETCKDMANTVTLIGPEVTQFVKLVSKQEVPSILESMDLKSKDLIIFALNSMQDSERAGGSHWSLLAFLRERNEWIHLDSSKGFNSSEAQVLANKVSDAVGANSKSVKHIDCLQQKNGYDCGCFLIKHAQHLVKLYSQDKGLDTITIIKEDEMKSFRSEMVDLIYSLRD